MPIGSVRIESVGATVDQRRKVVELWMGAGGDHIIHPLNNPVTSVYEPGLETDPTLTLSIEEARQMHSALSSALGRSSEEEAKRLKNEVADLNSRLAVAITDLATLQNEHRLEVHKSFKLATAVDALEKVDLIRQDHLRDLQKMVNYLQLSVEAETFNGSLDALMKITEPAPAGTPQTKKGRGDF